MKDEEEEAKENYPENLQQTDRYYAMEEALDQLEEAFGALKEAIDCLQSIE